MKHPFEFDEGSLDEHIEDLVRHKRSATCNRNSLFSRVALVTSSSVIFKKRMRP